MPPALAHDDPAFVSETVEPKAGEKQMQDRRVVDVLHVLQIELPVVVHDLGRAADQLQRRLAQGTLDKPYRFRPEEGFDVGDLGIEGTEDQPAELGHLDRPQTVPGLVEIAGHAAPAVRTVLERHVSEVALEVVGPGVIDAGQALDAAPRLQAQQRAAMGAAIEEAAKRAVLATNHEHRRLADFGGFVIPVPGQFGRQAEEIPHRALVDIPKLPPHNWRYPSRPRTVCVNSPPSRQAGRAPSARSKPSISRPFDAEFQRE